MSKMPEPIEIMETISVLYEHDLSSMVTDAAAKMKVIRRLAALGWQPERALVAVLWVAGNRDRDWH